MGFCSRGISGVQKTLTVAQFIYVAAIAACFLAEISRPLRAQEPASQSNTHDDVSQLVRSVIQNELKAEQDDHSRWRFLETREEDGKQKLYEVCQTKDGDIERLMSIDRRKLNAQEQAAEDKRIQTLLAHPGRIREKQKKQQEDAKQVQNLLKEFPEGFLFQFSEREGDLVKVSFTPNPKFHPHGRPAQVFHHMAGTLTIDEKAKRITEINGRLATNVKFGDGLLGHLDQGGTFLVKQQNVGSGHWDTVVMNVHMNGKILFLKTIAVRQTESYSSYKPVPDNLSLKQAAEELKSSDRSARKTS